MLSKHFRLMGVAVKVFGLGCPHAVSSWAISLTGQINALALGHEVEVLVANFMTV